MDRQRIVDKLQRSAILGGDSTYKPVRELGRGGNGVAILCKAAGAAENVVAKIYIPPDTRDLDDRALDRFQNEIAITKKLRHPNIVRAIDTGTIKLGAYRLPFYIMPVASATLRSEINSSVDADVIERKFRLFSRVAQGVAFLHYQGIVHRDLKPENVLLDRGGNPLIADLGIAHINPDFVSVGIRTIAAEKLLNRDYYAPEQRFGASTTAVDHRADIYALGLILYEMLTEIPPVRVKPPRLKDASAALEPLDPIWERMTDWDVERRFTSVDAALEEAWIAIGLSLAIMRGASGLRNPDLKTMGVLLKSNNEMQRRKGIEVAGRLGRSALTELHTLLGHGRREVRSAAATALAYIGEAESIPYLVGALYGNSARPRHFRAAAETAAGAIASFSEEDRLRAIKLITQPIRPNQTVTILKGVDKGKAYDAAQALIDRGLLLLDWSESSLEVLVQVDEERAWPDVLRFLEDQQYSEALTILKIVSSKRRAEGLKQWVSHCTVSWYFKAQIRLLENLDEKVSDKLAIFEILEAKIGAYEKNLDERRQLLQTLALLRLRKSN